MRANRPRSAEEEEGAGDVSTLSVAEGDAALRLLVSEAEMGSATSVVDWASSTLGGGVCPTVSVGDAHANVPTVLIARIANVRGE